MLSGPVPRKVIRATKQNKDLSTPVPGIYYQAITMVLLKGHQIAYFV